MPRAWHARQLQQYLRGELERAARAPTIEEVLDRVETRRGGRVRGQFQ